METYVSGIRFILTSMNNVIGFEKEVGAAMATQSRNLGFHRGFLSTVNKTKNLQKKTNLTSFMAN